MRIPFIAMLAIVSNHGIALAQAPSYSREIRPFLSKYCVECHNSKVMKGTLDLESYKSMMSGSDTGPVIKAGRPDESKLLLLTEQKQKPTMPPPKAKHQPTKEEVKLLRAWVLAGAIDDGANVKVELPTIKPRGQTLPPVAALALIPGRDQLVIAHGRQITMVDLAKGLPLHQAQLPATISCLAALPNAPNVLAIGGQPGERPRAFPFTATGEVRDPIPLPHTDSILDVAYDPRSNCLATSGYDSLITLTAKDLPQKVLKEHSDAVYGLAFSPDGTMLASVAADRTMKVWDVATGRLLYTLGEATDWLYTTAWSPDGKMIACGGVDKSIRVYEPTPTGARLRQSVFAHEAPVLKLLFSRDSKTLFSLGQDRVIKAWDAGTMVEKKIYDRQPESLLCMCLHEKANQIIVGRYDGVVQLIDMKTGKIVRELLKATVKKTVSTSGRSSRFLTAGRSDAMANAPPSVTPWAAVNFSVGDSKSNGPSPTEGFLDRAGAVAIHPLEARAGQSLGIRLMKDEKSKLDPVLSITDRTGRIIAESYDGNLGYTFTDPGKYAIRVRDREYRGGADFKYRLEIGDFPVLTEIFPLGIQRGTNAEFRLGGVNLPKQIMHATASKDAKVGDRMPLPLGDGVLGKAEIVIGEFTEVTSGPRIPVPGTANGRLRNVNQTDLWSFTAKKGQRLIVEVEARRLGSRLDSIIEILDEHGNPVPRAVLRSQAKTHVTFRDHDSVQGNIRIETWSELATNDYLYVGGELMKIQSLPAHPDADCNFFQTQGQRIGYLDTTPVHHANNTPMYKVTIHPPGTLLPPNGYPVFPLYYRNDDGGPGFGRDSRIIFDPPADGEYKVRIADTRGLGGVNFGYRLTVRPPREHFTVQATTTNAAVSRGSAIPVTLTADRIDGYEGPIDVRFESLPPGFHLPATRIAAGLYSTTIALYADATATFSGDPRKVILKGAGTGQPNAVSYQGTFDLPRLIEPGDLVTTVKESEVTIKPGGQSKLTVHIERRNGFAGRVPIEVRGLPHGIRVLDIGLNGILVNEDETTRTVVIYAEPWVQAQVHPFVVLARREGKSTEHAAKSVMLKVQ